MRQARAEIKSKRAGQAHREIGVPMRVDSELSDVFRGTLAHDTFDGRTCLPLIQNDRLIVKDAPTIEHVCVHSDGCFGLLQRSATYAAYRWNGVNEWQQLVDVVAIRACQDRADRNAVGVYQDVVLGTWSRAIRGVRASFSPAPTARTDEESTAAREKSSSPASRNFASSSSCNRFHTPAFCQSRSRRQQVEPEPNPDFVDRQPLAVSFWIPSLRVYQQLARDGRREPPRSNVFV